MAQFTSSRGFLHGISLKKLPKDLSALMKLYQGFTGRQRPLNNNIDAHHGGRAGVSKQPQK